MDDELGNQTVDVIVRTRVKRGEYVEAAPDPWPGCSVQPVGAQEGLPIEATTRWVLYAPAGFPLSTENVLDVEGIGPRLHVDGDLQPWVDEDGEVDHVWGYLKKWEASNDGG